MLSFSRYLLALLSLPLALAACSNSETPIHIEKPVKSQSLHEAPLITVLDQNDQALKGAQILIGDALNNPFSGNFLTVNDAGQVEVPAEWTMPTSITVHAAGYMRVTYLNQQPGAFTFKLRKLASDRRYEVRGVATKQPVVDFDGWVDFGLVIPALSKADMLSFDLNTIVSPQKDQISVIGQTLKVPSNISLQAQRERYALFTINLDKPAYRIYYNQPQEAARVFAARGRFPFREVVDRLRNKESFLDIINLISLTGGGIRDVEVRAPSTELNIPVTDLNFTGKRKVTAPRVKADESFLALGISEKSGYMIPTDVKKFNPGEQLEINTLLGTNQQLLGLLKKTNEISGDESSDRMSAALIPFSAGSTTPLMLGLIANPCLNGTRQLALTPPARVNGVFPLATYSVLSRVQEKTEGENKFKEVRKLWEVYAPDWVTSMQVPQWPQDKLIPAGPKRWESNFIGSQTSSQVIIGPAIIESATHVTHSSTDF